MTSRINPDAKPLRTGDVGADCVSSGVAQAIRLRDLGEGYILLTPSQARAVAEWILNEVLK